MNIDLHKTSTISLKYKFDRIRLPARNILIVLFITTQIVFQSLAQIITTIAGTGVMGSTGDGGPATAAEMAAGDLAFNRNGSLLLAEGINSFRVRLIDTLGTIITFAGNGTPGYSGDGGPATDASSMRRER